MNKYPRLCFLALSFVFAYVLYHVGAFDWLDELHTYGYISIFIAGLLFSFGFTTPFAIAIFVELAPFVHPLVAAPIAGAGALTSDMLIFDLIRFSVFHDEVMQLRSSKFILWIHGILHRDSIPEKVRRWMLWSFAGIIIASPLPDELGVSLVSGISQMQPRNFSIMCFCFNTLGVLLLLLAIRAVV